MAKSKSKKVPQSFFGRATRILGAGAVVLGREVGSAIASKMNEHPELAKIQTRVKQAQDLVAALSSLKGAAMKAGQLLSLEMSDLLPAEVVEILRTLHDNATCMPYEDVRKILIKELGKEAFKSLKDISETPIASASIGQVHRAKLRGKDVVLKVQYPGVANSIDTDLAVLKKIVSAFLVVKNKRISFDGVFAELAEGLKLEVDYLKEAQFLKQYKTAFAHLPQYVVPDVYEDFSTARVLTLSYESGIRLNQWLKDIKTDDERHHLSDLVLGLLYYEVFETGLVQTDPNYGNFLVRADQGMPPQLVILDFGAVRSYGASFRADVRRLLAETLAGNKKEMLRLATDFDLLDDREPQAVKDHFFSLMDKVVFMFKPENQPFDFSNGMYLKDLRETALGFADIVHHTSPAKHMIFLNRKLGGMFHLLKDANCKVDVGIFWRKVQDLTL